MPKPHSQIPDELISAYLDGEVDSQQRAQVEQLLGSEPRYQQLLEELRTLRETLQSLPRRQLDPEFHKRVLRTAQQRSAAADQVARTPKSASRTSSGGFHRGLIWAAAAIAAAILLTVFGPESDKREIGPVAQNPPALAVPDSSVTSDDRDARALRRRPYAEGGEDVPSEGRAPTEPAAKGGAEGVVLDAEDLDLFQSPKGGVETMDGDDDGSGVMYKAVRPDGEVVVDALGESPEIRLPMSDPPARQPATELATDDRPMPESERMLEESTAPESAELLADAVIRVRLAATDKNPDARLADYLLRNQIAVVGQEPLITRAKRAVDERSEDGAIYRVNQRRVDVAVEPAESDTKFYRLYLVQGLGPQIATAVNELQQEGGTVEVLTPIDGPQPEEAAGYQMTNGVEAQAGRITSKAATLSAKGRFERFAIQHPENRPAGQYFWDEIIEGTKAVDERLARTNNDVAPARGARIRETLGRETSPTLEDDPLTRSVEDAASRSLQTIPQPAAPVPPDRIAGGGMSDDSRGLEPYRQQLRSESPAPVSGKRSSAAPSYGRARYTESVAPVHLGQSAIPPDSLQAGERDGYRFQALVKDPQALPKQLAGMGTSRGRARPLQVLFVLQGAADLAGSTADTAASAAEASADPAPSDPR